jgi:RHS repeat-associated protein
VNGNLIIAQLNPNGSFYWLHLDHLGSGRKMTDISGTMVYRAEFDPYGKLLYEWSSPTNLNTKKFTGYERDAATNLDYAQARMYSSDWGRFISPDPGGLSVARLNSPKTLNQYSYVWGDPVNMNDPSGLSPYPIAVCQRITQWIDIYRNGQLYASIPVGFSEVCYTIWTQVNTGGQTGGSGQTNTGNRPQMSDEAKIEEKEFKDCANEALDNYNNAIRTSLKDLGFDLTKDAGIEIVGKLAARKATSVALGSILSGAGIALAIIDLVKFAYEENVANNEWSRAISKCNEKYKAFASYVGDYFKSLSPDNTPIPGRFAYTVGFLHAWERTLKELGLPPLIMPGIPPPRPAPRITTSRGGG